MASEAGERSVSRRDFLKKTGVLAAGVAAAGLVGCDDGNEEDKPIGGPSSNIDLENVTWDVSGDVVVVGGGGAGCSCALAAAEAGLTVILLESSAALGGCTALAVGSLTTPGSQMQRDKGITDSAEAYLEDAKRMIGESGVARSGEDWAIFEMQAAEGGKTIDWLVEHGVTFNGPFVYPGHTNDRMHMLTPNTSAWPGILQPQMEAAGVRIYLETKGMELVVDDGRVVGVMAIDQITKQELYFRGARGVFIATASIDASYEMKIKAYADPDIAAGDASCAFNDGQGLRMCQKIGADLTGWDSPAGQSLRAQAPSVNVGVYGKQSWMPFGMIAAGAIMVTKQGKRYASEDIGGQEMSIQVSKLPERLAWMVYDDGVAQAFQTFPDMVVSSMPAIGWGTVKDFVEAGSIMVGDTIEEVAQKAGVDAAGLAAEVEKYNSYAQAGNDPDFGRKVFGRREAGTLNKGLIKPPFYIHGPHKGETTSSSLTLCITTDFEVKDVFGDVIPGLFAGGNAGKGLAPMSIGHGTQLTWAFTSGRLAGERFATR